MRRLVSIGLVGFWIAGSATALAERVIVIPVIVGETDQVTLSSINGALSEVVPFRKGLSLVDEEELFALGLQEKLQALRSCGSDRFCVAKGLREADVRLGVLVLVNAAVDPPLVLVELIDASSAEPIGDRRGAIRVSGEPIVGHIRARAESVFELAGYEHVGRVIVAVSPESSKVVVGDPPGAQPDNPGGQAYTLPPGSYQIQAEHEEHHPQDAKVDVVAGQVVPINLVLERLPEETTLFESPWFWGGVGVAAVAAVTIAIVAASQTHQCLCAKGKDAVCPTEC